MVNLWEGVLIVDCSPNQVTRCGRGDRREEGKNQEGGMEVVLAWSAQLDYQERQSHSGYKLWIVRAILSQEEQLVRDTSSVLI